MVVKRERDAEQELNLPPGFRFHPTDEELVVHYLCRKATHQFIPVPIIAEVDLYKYNPWQLPDKALFGQKEWYFFTPRDRKYPNGSRPNRAAGAGYWKATGADKPVTPAGSSKPLGIKKALVFYSGKAPRGAKTNWIMHEYRLADTNRGSRKGTLRLDDWVLCRLYNKKNNWEKEMQQHQTEEASFGETIGSFEATEEVRSDNHRTPESDVDNDVYAEFPYQGYSLDPAHRPNEVATAGSQTGERVREDSDWFTDLNLDDLHNSFATFGEGAAAASLDLAGYQNYYYSGLPSPMPRTSTSTSTSTYLGVQHF